eukprot:8932274-Alexandrium_andersonii.AAC.1
MEAQSAMTRVPFDLVSSSAVSQQVEWLDLNISFDQHLSLVVQWAPRHISTPPAWDMPFSQLQCYILGRIHRWAEIELPLPSIPVVTAVLVSGLLDCGWTRRHFQWCRWSIALGTHCKYRRAFVQCLVVWLRATAPAPRSAPPRAATLRPAGRC